MSFSERKYLKSEGLKVRISEQNPKEKHIFFWIIERKYPRDNSLRGTNKQTKTFIFELHSGCVQVIVLNFVKSNDPFEIFREKSEEQKSRNMSQEAPK
ncbi:hypothetical protein CIK90_10155 [Prevotella sp. P5-126]|nr:hypothetical protein CIK90_10155 [Prevotella sp. P5-126]